MNQEKWIPCFVYLQPLKSRSCPPSPHLPLTWLPLGVCPRPGCDGWYGEQDGYHVRQVPTTGLLGLLRGLAADGWRVLKLEPIGRAATASGGSRVNAKLSSTCGTPPPPARPNCPAAAEQRSQQCVPEQRIPYYKIPGIFPGYFLLVVDPWRYAWRFWGQKTGSLGYPHHICLL